MHVKKSRGFTLLEVLITIAIAGIILTALYLLVGRGFGISRELTEQTRITEDARINTRRLARLVQHAATADGKSWVTASGPYELAFTAQLDDDPELEHVRIFLESTELKQTTTQLDARGNPISGGSETITLARSVRNAETNQPIFTLHQPSLLPYPTLTDLTLVIDVTPNTKPPAATIQTAVTPRNLLRQYGIPEAPGTSPPPEEAPPCVSEQPYDFVLTMDASASISRKEFKQVRALAKRLATSLLTSAQPSRFGVVTFGSEGEGRVALPLTNNLEQALKAIDNLPSPNRKSNTDIQEGLELAHNELKSSRRLDVEPVIVLLTDGAHNQPGDPIEQARLALQDGVDIFVVTVGLEKRIEEEFRAALAELGLLDHLFPIEDFEGLIDALNKLYRALCPGSATPLPVPSQPPNPSPITCQPGKTTHDIMHVVDSSGSIRDSDYDLARDFVKDVSTAVIIPNAESRVGVVIFSSEKQGKVVSGLTNDLPYLRGVIDKMPHLKGDTHIGEGLNLALQEFIQRGRDGVSKNIILITDGEHNQGLPSPIEVAQKAQNEHGITIFLVVIDPPSFFWDPGFWYDNNKNNIIHLGIASSRDHIFPITGYDELISVLDDISEMLCLPEPGAPTPAATPSPGPTLPPLPNSP